MNDPVFELGIVLAGAISAGAYSAGVMDFVFEALEAYAEAKLQSDWNGPTHDVRIPIMAGASAGGMTAAISALHAFHELQHVWPCREPPEREANRLYSSWVTDISIEALLETSDLEKRRKEAGVKSALCCDVLERIVDDAFVLKGLPRKRSWIGRSPDHSLRLLLTLTNLRGVPYSFALFGANSADQYGMLYHGDYLDFTIGIQPTSIEGSRALDIDNTSGTAWDVFRKAALGTGAFPIGLAPRRFERPPSDYPTSNRVGYEDSITGFHSIPPDPSITACNPYDFVSIDGGVIDNEPLELARRYLAGTGQHNERAGDKASKAVILIAPFPNLRRLPKYEKRDRVIDIIPELFATLIDQARFKPDELALAENETVFSRFIIAPIRPANGNSYAEKYPIASGVLNGFGGFLHESFRRHDYLLGRRNAQAFLRWNFALPETNGLFSDPKISRDNWYVRDVGNGDASIGASSDANFPYKLFAAAVGGPPNTRGLPIIPLVPKLCSPIEIGFPDQPRPDSISREDLFARIQKRTRKVIATLVDRDLRLESENRILGPLLRVSASLYAAHQVTQKAEEIVGQALDDIARAFPLR